MAWGEADISHIGAIVGDYGSSDPLRFFRLLKSEFHEKNVLLTVKTYSNLSRISQFVLPKPQSFCHKSTCWKHWIYWFLFLDSLATYATICPNSGCAQITRQTAPPWHWKSKIKRFISKNSFNTFQCADLRQFPLGCRSQIAIVMSLAQVAIRRPCGSKETWKKTELTGNFYINVCFNIGSSEKCFSCFFSVSCGYFWRKERKVE